MDISAAFFNSSSISSGKILDKSEVTAFVFWPEK